MPMSEGAATPEEARAAVTLFFGDLAGQMSQSYGDIGDLDQYVSSWRDSMSKLGVDLTDTDQLWAAAIAVERFMMFVATATERSCSQASHVLGHVREGGAPIVLLLDSAIKTYGDGNTVSE